MRADGIDFAGRGFALCDEDGGRAGTKARNDVGRIRKMKFFRSDFPLADAVHLIGLCPFRI